MAGFKNGKIMLPIKEFLIVKEQATYELNTIDMAKVTIFYRKYNKQAFLETYQVMPKGDYRINEVGGNKQLQITNLDILDEYYSIQLCRVVDLTSSPYSPSGEIDVITLNQHLNEVIDDVKFLFGYLKDVGMVMDSSAGNKILAELKPLTTWYMDENGNMAALPIDSLFDKFQGLVEEIYKQTVSKLDAEWYPEMIAKFEKYVEGVKKLLEQYLAKAGTVELEKIEKKGAEQIELIKTETDTQIIAVQHEAELQIQELQSETQKGKDEIDGYIEENKTNLKGDKGDPGIQGPQGIPGVQGETGPQGPVGDTGPKGDSIKGDAGDVGPQGPQGIPGPQGPKGPQGDVGPQGPQGVQGTKGDKGDKGEQGANGVSIPIQSGRFVMTVEGDDLVMYYNDGTTPPQYEINDKGELVEIFDIGG